MYALSFFIPLVGIIAGVIYMSKGDPESSSLGKMCLIISVTAIVIGCCIGGVTMVLPGVLEAAAG